MLWSHIANEKAQVTLKVLWAVVDHGDDIWHAEAALFPLRHVGGTYVAGGGQAPDINP